jgi:PBSX family phage portal protein
MTQQKMKVKVVKAEVPSTTSKQIYDDPFKNQYNGEILAPPYNLKELKLIGEYSTIIQQCVEAYKTNILGFGFQPKYRFDYNAESTRDDLRKKADEEWTRLEEFYRYLNYDEEAETILGYALDDREKMGNGYVEVLRDSLQRPAGIEYVDGQFIRVCKKSVPEEIDYKLLKNGTVKSIKRWRSFRKYVQEINGKKVWFKEYGDPRIMNLTNGKYDESTPEHLQATEIIHFKIGSGTYGIPRWIGHIVNVYGTRKAEELNFLYFKHGRHTPAAIIVENGMLSEDSVSQLQEYMSGIEGVDNAHKFLLLEAEGVAAEDVHGDEKVTPVKVQIKSLAEILQQDALFLEYDTKSRDKLRSAFRLPPLYTGESQDYNKATADTARKITEEQVFKPERKNISGKLNTLFLNELEIYFVSLTLKGPNFGDPLETAKVLTPFINAGSATPNDLRELLGQVLGKDLEMFPEEYNVPLQMLMRNAAPQQPFPIAMQKSTNTDLINILKDLRDVLEESNHE